MFRNTLALVAFAAVGSAASVGFADVVSAAYWGESYTDSSGNYNSPVVNGTVNGGVLSAPIQTDATSAAPDNDVVNYLRTRSDIPGATSAYFGTLLGNLSGQASVTATFNISNSALTPGQQFTLSQLVGETGGNDPGIRLTFTGALAPTSSDSLGAANQWWSEDAAIVTSMTNGNDVTLTVDFNPADWTNVYGHQGDSSAAETADFNSALAKVKYMGLSFGSGDFYADGFAFNTGGDAAINVSSFSTGPSGGSIAVPAPSSLWSCVSLLAGMGLYRFIKRSHRPVAC